MTVLTDQEALLLFRDADLHELGALADAETVKRHPGSVRTYIVDRNINYTNICGANCRFCNFHRPLGHDQSYVLAFDELLGKVDELFRLGGRQVLLQGGLHPTLPFDWYCDMLRTLKSAYPAIHIHGFSPPEIAHFAETHGKSDKRVLAELMDAGLDTMPGGGAEILVDSVRRAISGKCDAQRWLDVMREAHGLGMRTTATMMFGHVETIADRIEHLSRLRELQDQTGGFTAFICWTFQSCGTELARDIDDLQPTSVQEYLRMLAVARLYLHNFENLQASWVTQGPAVGQVALKFGANDFGSLMLEENVVASAGTSYQLSETQLRQLIEQAGYKPKRRNCYYEIVEAQQ